VRHVVVLLDVLKVRSVLEGRSMVQVLEIVVDVGVVLDHLEVAFEVTHVDGVEPHQSGVQANVGLSDLISRQEATLGQNGLHFVQRLMR